MRIRDEGKLWRVKRGPHAGTLCRALGDWKNTKSGEDVWAEAKAKDMVRVQLLVDTHEGLWGGNLLEVRKRDLERVIQITSWVVIP